MPQASIASKTKHIYYADVSDEGGNRAKIMTGVITIGTSTGTTATLNPNFTADIPNLDGVWIQGEDGYNVQYEYSTADIKIMQTNGATASDGPQIATTNDDALNNLNFRYFAWGY